MSGLDIIKASHMKKRCFKQIKIDKNNHFENRDRKIGTLQRSKMRDRNILTRVIEST